MTLAQPRRLVVLAVTKAKNHQARMRRLLVHNAARSHHAILVKAARSLEGRGRDAERRRMPALHTQNYEGTLLAEIGDAVARRETFRFAALRWTTPFARRA